MYSKDYYTYTPNTKSATSTKNGHPVITWKLFTATFEHQKMLLSDMNIPDNGNEVEPQKLTLSCCTY